MSHVIVTRFAVPRPGADSAELYRDRTWLEGRLELFERWFVPSVSRLGLPAVLLCGRRAADFVAERVAHLEWARVEVQNDWRGGWTGTPEQVLTRLDSDDALDPAWFDAVDRAPASAGICICKDFLRWDPRAGRLHEYRRAEPAPLAAFRGGANPYAVDHKHLETLDGVHRLRGTFLLQVVHDGNLKNSRPKPWRLDRRRPLRRLEAFGVTP